MFKLCGGFPIPDNAFLPEVSLQAKLPCDGQKNERWVRGVPVRPPDRRDRSESRVSISAGNVPGPSMRTSGISARPAHTDHHRLAVETD